MGDRTGIEWTDASWNVFRGCSRTIAPGTTQSGCGDPSGGGCYAERNGWRFAGDGGPYDGLVRMTPNGARWTGKVLLVDKHLLDPIRWERPRKIFTTAVGDPFHERNTNAAIAVVVGVMVVTRRHTHQLLTKRAARMPEWFAWVKRAARAENGGRGMSPAAYCFALLQRYVSARRDVFTDADRKLLARADVVEAALSAPWPLPNAWPMVSVENQAAADDRIPHLLATPAVVRGLSIEPMLGPVDLDPPLCDDFDRHGDAGYCIADDGGTPWCSECDSERSYGHWLHLDGGIDWVIAGCESGPGARPADAAWFRSLRDQCAAAGVPFFLKQAWAEFWPDGTAPPSVPITAGPGSHRKPGGIIGAPYLDGVQHLAFPVVGDPSPAPPDTSLPAELLPDAIALAMRAPRIR